MSLSNTATPVYYEEFRDAVIRGEIPVCREIEMEMNRIDALIDDPGVYYDEDAVKGFILFCEEINGDNYNIGYETIFKPLNKRKVDVVIANNGYIDASMADKYKTLEQKDPVIFDNENFKDYDMQVIGDDLVTIYNNMIRHNSLKLGFHIFFYAMNN